MSQLGTDFDDIGDAGVEALAAIDQAWLDTKALLAQGIVGAVSITRTIFETVVTGGNTGRGNNTFGDDTGTGLPGFSLFGPTVNPVTGETVELGPPTGFGPTQGPPSAGDLGYTPSQIQQILTNVGVRDSNLGSGGDYDLLRRLITCLLYTSPSPRDS